MKNEKDMWNTNPKLAKLLADPKDGYKYTQMSKKRVDWKCPECGYIIKNKSISQINQYRLSCPICSDGISYPNKLLHNLIVELSQNYKIQYCFEYKVKWFTYIDLKHAKHKGSMDCYLVYNNYQYDIAMVS